MRGPGLCPRHQEYRVLYGKTYRCRSCRNDAERQRYHKNREFFREKRRVYGKNNREKLNEYHGKYRRTHPETIKKIQKRHRESHGEKTNELRRNDTLFVSDWYVKHLLCKQFRYTSRSQIPNQMVGIKRESLLLWREINKLKEEQNGTD